MLNLATTPGYSIIEYREVEEHIKNTAHFSAILKNMIDESKSLRVSSHYQKYLGVIVNIPASDRDNIDYSFKEIIDRYGSPDKKFMHIQSVPGLPTFIAFISTGMQLPLDEIQAVYDRYVKSKSGVDKDNTDKNNFFSDMRFDEDDEEVSYKGNSSDDKAARNAFFASFNMQTPNLPERKGNEDKLNNY